MRIIGGHDYYDGGLAFGRDEAVVFVREKDRGLLLEDVAKHGLNPSIFRMTLRDMDSDAVLGGTGIGFFGHDRSGVTRRGETYIFYAEAVVLCGKIYGGIRVDYPGQSGAESIHFWDKEALTEWFARRGMRVDDTNENAWFPFHDSRTPLERYFVQTPVSRETLEWLISEKITVMSWEQGSRLVRNIGGSEVGGGRFWRVNGFNLHELQFYKALGVTEAFQEISMWVSGVLTGQDRPMVKILDDKIIAHKAGHDYKTSFRKPKAS